MKYLVASDIHGSLFYTNKIIELFNDLEADNLILLGDLYYHGPRNPLPLDYNPMEVSKKLNEIKDKILVVKGNCDAEVDQMISDFLFHEHIELEMSNLRFYFTHGHRHNIDNIPENVDILIYGHFHTGFIKDKDGVICINAGSVSLPKNNTPNSYLIITDEIIELKDFDGNTIEKINIY